MIQDVRNQIDKNESKQASILKMESEMEELKFASTEKALQHLSNLTGARIKIASSGYVEESLEDALDSIGLASGGMDYRVNDKDGSLNLDHDEVEKVRSAMSNLEKAKKMVMQARSNLQGIDLGYTGKRS